MDFPKMLYRCPGPLAHEGGTYATRIVADEAEQAQAQADGWNDGVIAARQAYETALVARDAQDLERLRTAPPTRAEMETKARELEIKFDGRTSDAKLLKLIEAALAPA